MLPACYLHVPEKTRSSAALCEVHVVPGAGINVDRRRPVDVDGRFPAREPYGALRDGE